ncbi:MAG: 6-phosphogluconolactonase [Anaerolineae bacterium]|nr:6-phosphogluconolactonase [Anaerolineae bacterium]
MSQVRVYPTRIAAAHAAAAQFVATAEKATTARGRFSAVLAGGNTPRDVYRLLASDEYAPMVSWQQTQVFWGDERAVSLSDPENNGRMARETLLNYVPIPVESIHRIESSLPPQEAALAYEHILRDYFAKRGMNEPRFDLVFLGMGEEGHTASLFPRSPALRERERWVVATYVEPKQSWRITLTPVALNAASKIIFLVIGEEKAEALRQVLSEPKRPDEFPAQAIDPPQGQVLWIVDKAAASLIDK